MRGLVQQLSWLGLDWVVCLHFFQLGVSAVCLCLCLVWPLVRVGLVCCSGSVYCPWRGAGVQLGPGFVGVWFPG